MVEELRVKINPKKKFPNNVDFRPPIYSQYRQFARLHKLAVFDLLRVTSAECEARTRNTLH